MYQTILIAVLLLGGCESIEMSEHVGHVEADGGIDSCADVVCDPTSIVADPCCETVAPPATTIGHRVTLHASAAESEPQEAWFDRTRWQVPTVGGVYFPLAMDVGCTLTQWSVYGHRPAGASTFTASVRVFDSFAAAEGIAGPQVGATSFGDIALASPQFEYVALPANALTLEVWADSTLGASFVYAAEYWFRCPVQ